MDAWENLEKIKGTREKLGRGFSDSGGAESTGLFWRGHQRETIAGHIQGVAGLDPVQHNVCYCVSVEIAVRVVRSQDGMCAGMPFSW